MRDQLASYTYNEQGIRTSKTVNSAVTNFSYNGSMLMAQVTGSGAGQVKQLYSYDASGQLVSVNYNGTEYYYMRNGQSDVVGLMDSTGAVVVSYSYDSWGKSLTVSGTLATTLGQGNPFRYRGYYYDTETGLYYLQTRYYDATVCRFIAGDVYFSTSQGIVGSNWFILGISIIRNDWSIYSMSGSQKLQVFQGILVITGICIILLRCLPLIKELKEYKGVSARTGRHDLIRVYQIILKPWGLVLTFFLIYFCLRMMYVCTYDKQQVVFYDYWPGMFFGFAALAICFPLYAILERMVLKNILKNEYLDYCFWDFEISSNQKRRPSRNETIIEESPAIRLMHYGSIFTCIVLGAFFIAAGFESMDYYRAICHDRIFETRANGQISDLPYSQIYSIKQDSDFPDRFIVTGKSYQLIYIIDEKTLEYIVDQSGIQIDYLD